MNALKQVGREMKMKEEIRDVDI